MAVRISSDLLAAIIADAAGADEEVCGLLLGRGNRVETRLACRNVAAEPAVSFEIDPAQLIAAHRAARSGGPTVLGSYHSHPGGIAEPSARDAAAAAPDGSLWLIIGAGSAKLWRATAQGRYIGRFDAEEIITE